MHDFDRDVNDPVTRHAEEAVGAWLRRSYSGAFVDERHQKGAYDFSLRLTFDVKCSRWLNKNGTVTYEYVHEYDGGGSRPGWSADLALQYAIFVNPATWVGYLIRMRTWRQHVAARLADAHLADREVPRGWFHFPVHNPGYRTQCYAMPLAELEAEGGIVVREMHLPPYEEDIFAVVNGRERPGWE